MATQPMGDPLTAAVLGPDVVAQQMRMQQAQEYAHALMQQGMQGPPQGRMVGNHYVAPSWTQGLASALQMYMGRKGLDDLPNQAAELGKLQADGYRRAFGIGGSPMAPDAAAPAAMAAGAANGDTGPTLTNANRMNSMVAGQPSSAPMYQSLPGRSPQDSMMTAMGIGMPEYQKLLAQQLAPSAEATRGRELGVDQPTQLANYLAAQKKAGYIPLTRLAEGFYGDQNGQPIALPDRNNANIPLPDPSAPGGWRIAPIAGGVEAVTRQADAVASGKAGYQTAPGTFGPTGQPQPAQTMREFVQGGQAPQQAPQGRLPSGLSQNSDGRALTPELQQAIASDAAANGIPNPVAKFTGAAPGQAYGYAPNSAGAGRGTLTPPLGVVANANEAQKGGADAMNASYGALQKTRAGGTSALQDIDHMIQLGSQKNPLVAGKTMQGIAQVFSPNAAEYEKSRDNLVTQLSGQLGMSTDAAREMVYGSIPSYGAPKPAIQNGLMNLKNQVQARMAKADFLTQHFNAGDSNTYNRLENEFDQNISPKVAPLLSMPAGKARADALSKAAADPQARASLEWAVKNGLLK